MAETTDNKGYLPYEYFDNQGQSGGTVPTGGVSWQQWQSSVPASNSWNAQPTTTPDSKSPLKSKELWASVSLGVMGISGTMVSEDWVQTHPRVVSALIMMYSAAWFILRWFFTSTAINPTLNLPRWPGRGGRP